MTQLIADATEIGRFVGALFRYADEGTYVSLRAFDQFDSSQPARLTQAIRVNGDLGKLAHAATEAASRMANESRPVVFAPPICTFANKDRARLVDLANGLTLSVEIDDGNTALARGRLESLLGPATMIVASGGDWSDPETGEVHPKLHLHWRLSEATKTAEDHETLRRARDLAARLVGADPTGKPVVHPLRWPGSWNLKALPRLATILAEHADAEIHLREAAERIEEAVEAAGLKSAGTAISSDPLAVGPHLASAMAFLPNADVHYDEWIRIGYATYRATAGKGYDLWDAWSRKSEAKYNATEQEAAWRRIEAAIKGSKAPKTIGAGTIMFLASQAGWVRPSFQSEPPPDPTDEGYWTSLEASISDGPEVAEVGGSSAEVPESRPPQASTVIDPRNWTAPAPLREWLIDGWIPRGYVTGLYGDGAVGKSLIAQQLMTSVAVGLPWLGLDVKAGRAFGFMCEDDKDELHRRQEGINRAYGLEMWNLENLRYSSRVGLDNLLMTFDERNRGYPTDLMDSFGRYLAKFNPSLVVLDTLADIFGGDEIKRAHARLFVQGIGGRIARTFNCAVVIAAHPSMAGIQSGKGTGGSTAWNNTFRSRLYLTKPDDKEKSNQRQLSRMKANYAPTDAEITMKWADGVFATEVRQRKSADLEWSVISHIFDEIDAKWKVGDPWSVAPQTKAQGRYLPLWCDTMLGIRESMARKYIEGWLTTGHLRVEVFDQKTKSKGLRVIQRLDTMPEEPPVE